MGIKLLYVPIIYNHNTPCSVHILYHLTLTHTYIREYITINNNNIHKIYRN